MVIECLGGERVSLTMVMPGPGWVSMNVVETGDRVSEGSGEAITGDVEGAERTNSGGDNVGRLCVYCVQSVIQTTSSRGREMLRHFP
jgi:hypothetical protein